MGGWRCPQAQICGLDCRRILDVRVAVEFGVEAANCFDLGGQGLVTQKSALMRERNPELPDVAQRFAMYWINRDPKRPLAVRRLLPWIHLRHGDLPLRGNLIVSTGFSPRFRAFEPGFPRSPPSAHGGAWTSYAFLTRLGECDLRRCAPSTRDTLVTNAVGQMAHRHQTRNSWDGLSGHLAWV